jgi:Tfp pilus assembly protein PilF
MTRRVTRLTGSVLALVVLAALMARAQQGQASRPSVYRPALAVPELIEPFLKDVGPGNDAFPLERDAIDIEARLRELGDAMRGGPDGAARVAVAFGRLAAPDFRGAPFEAELAAAAAPGSANEPPLVVRTMAAGADAPKLDARAFGVELRRLVADMRTVSVTEFLVTSIAPAGAAQRVSAAQPASSAQPTSTAQRVPADQPAAAAPADAQPASAAPDLLDTVVRFDIVGSGPTAWRIERVGSWRMTWRKRDNAWQVVEWVSIAGTTSRAKRPIFSEVTASALGANDSFRQQLSIDLDTWMGTFDSVLTRDSNGHHGVSVGDADGDGLDDLYVAQPSGLPNRLYRARGDGTFEDITTRAGVGVLDDTAQSLFADIDNDGDQDLMLATGTRPLLFLNDGTGRFAPVADAFRFERPLQGVLTSITMADYDRDGFLDLYLCVYSYFFGAGEDKAGTPMPYYDARNGPPGVLFHNDGHGHFVDATKAAGLDEGNDRYHFAAAWGDYDHDGWPDLLVANDFGTKNLYHNRGRRAGASPAGAALAGADSARPLTAGTAPAGAASAGADAMAAVTFEDVAATAGVLDHGAGMSATFFDYDNDGQLDLYTGNMWSASGLRVTGMPSFMPDATASVRALYQHHARGNSLFRNRGDGRFDDRTLAAHAEMGRWAWSCDALDFDSDGFEDLYIANGMLTRDSAVSAVRPEAGDDLDSFFWRQVVARSPQTRAMATPYDDAWRAINQLLIERSIASHQRNVFLRNDGHGGFDDVSGAVGLDLDQDGRSFAVLDLDRDGDPDLAVMAARQAPQLRVFRNDFGGGTGSGGSGSAGSSGGGSGSGTWIALRLTGKISNRDAIGARVTVETDRLRRMRTVQAGSGFLSQHSKELLFGLGDSTTIKSVTVEWPSGAKQTFTDVGLRARLRLEEGGTLERETPSPTPSQPPSPSPDGIGRERTREVPASSAGAAEPPDATWLYEPFPAPDFSVKDARGIVRSLAAMRGKPAVLLFWSAEVSAARASVEALARGLDLLTKAGMGAIAIQLDAPPPPSSNTTASAAPNVTPRAVVPAVPPAVASSGLSMIRADAALALSYAIVHRHIFMNRQDPRLPTLMLLDAAGQVVKVYRGRVDIRRLGQDAAAIDASARDRLARALPFAGAFYSPVPVRNYLPYGRELLDQHLDAAAIAAFERAAQASPSASTLYRLGTLLAKTGETDRARAAFERALALQPAFAEASNDLGALLAQSGDLEGAMHQFRAAITAAPEYPDALNNLGYALLLTGQEAQARAMYEKALALQPDFPEALNNLGMLNGRAGDLEAAERRFRDALARRAEYGEAANNLALVLVARGQTDAAIQLLDAFIAKTPQFEGTYITLAKIHLNANRSREALAVLEKLLQRNPTQPVALELLRQGRPR